MSGFILCPVDGINFSEDVCDYGVYIANTTNSQIKFLNIVEHNNNAKELDLSGNIALGAKDDLLEKLTTDEQETSKCTIKNGKELLDTLKQRAQEHINTKINISQIHGEVVNSLIELKNDIKIAVLGIKGQGQHTIGENVKEVIREVHKPILLVNSKFQQPKKILIAYNGSNESKEILKIISNNLLFGDLQRTIININKNETTSKKLLTEAKKIFEDKNIIVDTVSLNRNKEDLINYFEENDFDILAMGAYSHSRVKEFIFGSFTSKIIENMKKPVLLYR